MALTMHARGSNNSIDWEVVSLHLDGFSMDEIVARIMESTAQTELRGRAPGAASSSLLRTASYGTLDMSQYLWTAFPGTSSAEVSPARPPPPQTSHSAPSAAVISSSVGGTATATSGVGSSNSVGVAKASVSPPSDSATVYSESERLAVVEFVEDHLQLLKLLEEELLPAPYVFVSTNASPLNRRDAIRLLELYYGLDDGLAELWFGDRLSRIEVEDDDLIEVGLPGLRQGTVQRQWRNLKRVCKTITAAYRGKDGMLIPRDIPLTQAISQVFVVPQELCQTYATLVFGFEHRLDCVSLEDFHVHELSSLCSAVGSLWCDASSLFLSEDFCKRVWRIGQILLDGRVVSEVAVALLGTDASKLLRQIKDTLGEVQKAIAPSTAAPSPPQGSTATAALHASAAAASGHLSSVHSASTLSLTPDGPSSSGPTPGNGTASPPPAPPAPLPPPPPPSQQQQQPHGHGGCAYSRRFVNEFHTIVRNLARICVQFGTAEKLRDVLDRYYTKIYAPLAAMGRDASSEAAASLRAGWSPAASTTTNYPTAAAQAAPAGLDAALRAGQYQVTNASFLVNTSSLLFAGGSSGDLAPSSLGGLSSNSVGPTATATTGSSNSSSVGGGGVNAGGNSGVAVRGGGGGAGAGGLPLADSRRYVRELCQFLPAFHRTFCALQTISAMEHAVLDVAAKDFFSVLRLYSQLLLAHD